MKFVRFLPALLLAIVVFAAGCGESKEKQQLDQLSKEQQALVASTLKDINAAKSEVDRISNQMSALSAQTQELGFSLRDSQKELSALTGKLDALATNLGASSESLASQSASANEAVSGGSWFKVLLLIVGIIFIIGLIYLVLRSRSDYDDEDDDFADFEDDDFADFEDDFEDEDFEDEDDKKKKGADDEEKK